MGPMLRRAYSLCLAISCVLSTQSLLAQAPLVCTPQAAGTPSVRAEGHYEQTGDVIILCSGGTVSSTVQYAGLEVSLSSGVPFTSHTLDAAAAITEAFLLIDDPPPPAANIDTQPLCLTPLTPGACQTAKVFPGIRVSSSRLRFVFPFAPPGPSASRLLRLTNLRVAASQAGVPQGLQATVQVELNATLTGVPSPQVTLPLDPAIRPIVASVQKSVLASAPTAPPAYACADTNIELALNPAAPSTADGRNFVVRVIESSFPSAFKKRTIAQAFTDSDPPPVLPQAFPGVIFQTESGFFTGRSPGIYSKAGLAASGARFYVRIHSVPAGVRLFAPALVRLKNAQSNAVTGWAKRVTTDPDGVGDYLATASTTPIGGGLAPMDDLGSWQQAIYEIVETDPTLFENIDVPIYPAFLAATANGGLLGYSAGWAPLSGDITGESAITPRFSNLPVTPTLAATIATCLRLSISPTAATVPASGGAGSIFVTATVGTNWDVVSNVSWISTFIAVRDPIQGPFNDNNGVVSYSVAANSSAVSRTGTITIGTATITVTQAGTMTQVIQLNPIAASVPATAGEGVFSVTAAIPGWSATPNMDWLSIVSTNSTEVRYRYTANPDLSPRTGTILVGTATFTVTQAAGANVLGSGLRFIPVTPCRLIDTRENRGAFGQPSLEAAVTRSFALPAAPCGVPGTAKVYALNITVVPKGPLGYLTVWPTGLAQPFVSTLNSLDGRIKANAALVPAGANGAVSVFATGATELVVDINGYFIEPQSGVPGLAFYPLTPCRVIDTRAIFGPGLAPAVSRVIPIRGVCGVPANAQAYSLNATVVPAGPLGYLTLWPTFAAQPFVSTLNAPTGAIVANAAIVPAGPDGHINAFANAPTHLVIDINGYFAPPGAPGALAFNAVTPCRVADSRNPNGSLGGPALAAGLPRIWPVASSNCGLPASAGAYSMNATVVPPAGLGYLTMWPTGQAQPLVSTLNAAEDPIVANAAIVSAGTVGAISSFASSATHLVLDVNGYFAP